MSARRPDTSSETQEGSPSDVDPMQAREGLALQWWLAGLAFAAIAIAIVVVKLI